jgi:translation elongation factor EF-1beta
MNGYDCPCCRAQMADDDEDEDEDEDENEDVYSDADEEEFIFFGFRWFHQRIHSEELEGDAEEYDEEFNEIKKWDEECDKASEEVKAKIDNILIGLKTIKSVSYDELLKAFVHKNMEYFGLNYDAEAAFVKVSSTIDSICAKDWSAAAVADI